MAFTERYVSVAGAGAHDGTSEANAWTMAEGITSGVAGQRLNIKAGSYSQGAATIGTGTVSALIVWRGYNSTIGDLDAQGRSADGTLNVTNFPVVTITGILVIGPFNVLQNLDFTGALSSILLGGGVTDNWVVLRCRITNTQDNAAARCLQGDNDCSVIGSDLYCSGAAHASIFDADVRGFISDVRLRGTSSSALVILDDGIVQRSVLYGNSSSTGVTFNSAAGTISQRLLNNTIHGIGTAVTFPNVTPTGIPILSGNHVTDCSKWIDNLHSATAAISVIEAYNRLRDVTTPRTGVETVTIGEVTTDTGGAETDYVDAAGGNFHLISGAPGRATGTPPNVDTGAYQHPDLRGGNYQLGVV